MTPKVTNLLRSSLRQICPSEVIYSSRQSSTSHSRMKAESPHAHQTCVSMENLRILGARESQRRILYEIFMITEIFKFSCFWVCLVNNFHVFWWFEVSRCFRISLSMKFESFLNFYYNEEKFKKSDFSRWQRCTAGFSYIEDLGLSFCENKDAYVF